MKLSVLIVSILSCSTIASAVVTPDPPGHGFNIRVNHSEPLTRCDQLRVTTDEGEVAAAEETVTLARGPVVRIVGAKNGGVHIGGSQRSDYAITLCKFAVGASSNDAARRVGEISIARQASTFDVAMPADEEYLAYWIVQTPTGANVEAEVRNGPLQVRSADGRISARASNGPISLRGCSGEVDATTVNGPIHLSDGSGRIRLTAQNGPIGVDLAGRTWRGAGLDVSVANGPLKLRLPPDYQSGVELEVSRHSPFKCRGDACGEAYRAWAEGRRLVRFGAGSTLVRLSTRNGPVSIESER